jgi:hypothetical protein
MSRGKGLFGKLMDAATTTKAEQRQHASRGDRHGGVLGVLERLVTPDKDRQRRAQQARRKR